MNKSVHTTTNSETATKRIYKVQFKAMKNSGISLEYVCTGGTIQAMLKDAEDYA